MRITIDTNPHQLAAAIQAFEAVIKFADKSPNTSAILGIDDRTLSRTEAFIFNVKNAAKARKGERMGDK